MLRRNTLKTLCEESQLANPINKTNRGHSYKKGNLFLWKTLLQLQKILHDDSHAINFSMLYIACSTPPLLLTSLSRLFLCSCFLGLCSCNLLPWWGCLNKEFLSTWLCRFLEPYSTRDGWYSGYEKLLSISFLISANGSASHFTPCSEHNNLLTDILAHIIKAFKQLWKYYFFFSNTCVVKKWY